MKKVQNGINSKNDNVIIENNDSGIDDKSKDLETLTNNKNTNEENGEEDQVQGEHDYYFLIDQLDQFLA
jgi:hypothetical protein